MNLIFMTLLLSALGLRAQPFSWADPVFMAQANFKAPAASNPTALKTSLIYYFKCDESSGDLFDAFVGAGGQRGTNYGVSYSNAGQIGTSVGYAGTAGSGPSYTKTSYQTSTNAIFTIAFWVKGTEGSTAYAGILGEQESGYKGWSIDNSAGSTTTCRFYYLTGSGYSTILNIPCMSGAWTHVSCIVSNTAQFAYTNGVLFGTASNGSGMAATTSDTLKFAINPTATGQGSFVGTLDEIGFWNRALTPAEVTFLAQTNGYNSF